MGFPPGALHRLTRPSPREGLRAVSLVDLSAELLARLTSGEAYRTNEEAVLERGSIPGQPLA